MSRKRSRERDGHDYFTYEVRFLHRSVRDYIVNTREAQMRARIPDFDVCSGVLRLLLAEFKFALFTLHDTKPRVWAIGGEGGPLRKAPHVLFTVMCAAHENYGYDVPSRFFEEASHIVQHHTQTVGLGQKFSPETRSQSPKATSGGRICNASVGNGSHDESRIILPIFYVRLCVAIYTSFSRLI
jgi:hypothetical protein